MPSTSIRRTAYDRETRTLSVWFVASGTRYDYEDVPARTYADFRAVPSRGRFFNVHIRSHFRFRRIGKR